MLTGNILLSVGLSRAHNLAAFSDNNVCWTYSMASKPAADLKAVIWHTVYYGAGEALNVASLTCFRVGIF